MKSQPRTPVLGLLMAVQVLAWSFNYIFGKIALAHLEPWTMVSFRLVLAGCLYVPIFLLAPRPVRLSWRDLPTLGWLGFWGVVINQGGFTLSLYYTTVSHVALVVAIGPVLVLLLARINGMERLTAAKVTGMAMAFSGVAWLAARQGLASRSGGLAGDLIALGAATGFALFTVLGKRVAHRYDTVALNTFAHFTGAVLMLPLALQRAGRLEWRTVEWQGWVGLLYMVVFGSVVGYLIFYRLLGSFSASQVSSLNYLLPIGATVLGVVFLHDRIDRSFLAAGALVLAGVWLAESHGWRRAREA